MDGDAESLLYCAVCGQLSREPLLLACLHCCCASCVERCRGGGGDDGRSASSTSASPIVSCQKCREPMTVVDATINPFAAAGVRALAICSGLDGESEGEQRCSICRDRGFDALNAGAPVIAWCGDCCKALCEPCSNEHRVHVGAHQLIAIDADGVSAATVNRVASSIAAHCAVHERRGELLCLSCRALKCSACVEACRELDHRLEHCAGRTARQLAADAAVAITKSVNDLRSRFDRFASYRDAPRRLAEAQQRHVDELRRNKKTVLGAVDRAFTAAEEFVKDRYGRLRQRAIELADAAGRLEAGARAATAFGGREDLVADAANLLYHQEALLARLHSLSAEIDRFPSADALCSAMRIHSSLPDGLEQQCRQWVGVPRLDPGLLAGSGISLDDDDLSLTAQESRRGSGSSGAPARDDQRRTEGCNDAAPASAAARVASTASGESGSDTLGLWVESFRSLTDAIPTVEIISGNSHSVPVGLVAASPAATAAPLVQASASGTSATAPRDPRAQQRYDGPFPFSRFNE